MGGPKRLRKRWAPPKHVWSEARVKEEVELKKEFGLKNTRELWKAKAFLKKMRVEARLRLARPDASRSAQLLSRAKRYFIAKEDASIDDVLSLTVRDVLARRLQTIVWKKGFAKTLPQARQLIAHGHIAVEGRKVTAPGRLVSFGEEPAVDWLAAPIAAAPAGAEELGVEVALGISAMKAGPGGEEPKRSEAQAEKSEKLVN